MNNRMWNSQNPCQGNAQKILCVCSAGLLRSPSVANVLANGPYWYNTRSVGLESSFALIPIDEVLLHWADAVICMEEDQCHKIYDMGFDQGVIYNFQIPDCYNFMERELVSLIKEKADTIDEWIW